MKTGKRGEIFLATKFGVTHKPERLINGTKEYMRQQFVLSLTKLQTGAHSSQRLTDRRLTKMCTDYVDLYYLHRADVLVPIEETVTAMAELVKYALMPSSRSLVLTLSYGGQSAAPWPI